MVGLMKKIQLGQLNQKECARYLGYGAETPNEQILTLMKQCEEELCKTAYAGYLYRIFSLEQESEGDKIYLTGTDYGMSGASIREHLQGCTEVILLSATLSERVDRLIRRLEVSDMPKALIMDAMASVAVEAVCDAAEEEIKKEYQKSHGEVFFTWRYGFGYGDLPLEEERGALQLLEAAKYAGITINERNLMFPRKSVACVIGISREEIRGTRKGCTSCNMKERCKFRQRGERCGF